MPIGAGGEQRQRPAPAVRLGLGADGEAALEAALGDHGGAEPGQRHDRADREVDAAGQDDEGHADRQQAVDRDLAHDVEQVERLQEARIEDGEHRHQHEQEDQRRKLGEKAEQVDGGAGAPLDLTAHRRSTAHIASPWPARMEPGSRAQVKRTRGRAARRVSSSSSVRHTGSRQHLQFAACRCARCSLGSPPTNGQGVRAWPRLWGS